MRDSGLILPREESVICLKDAHLTEYGKFLLHSEWLLGVEKDDSFPPPIAGGASFSDAYETKILEHVAGKTTLTLVTPMYLALCTVVPTDSSTGVTITEATYTGYARRSVTAANFAAAVSGSPGSIKNGAELVYAACTASTSTIIGFALTDNATTSLGNIAMWGTCTSTVISTTQTPATIAVEALSMTLD